MIKGRDLIGETRWPKGLYDTPPRAGFIKGIDKFDAQFFQFTDTEVGQYKRVFNVCCEEIDNGVTVNWEIFAPCIFRALRSSYVFALC